MSKFKIEKLIRYFFDWFVLVEKIAFYINEGYIFDHYLNVMRSLDPEKFVVILAGKFKEKKYEHLVKQIHDNGWEYKYLEEVFYKYKFRVLVTHIYLGGNTSQVQTLASSLMQLKHRLISIFYKQAGLVCEKDNFKKRYFQKTLGVYNVRFMYGLDNGGAKLGEWNNLFDIFFCHGPFDAKLMSDLYKKPVYIMGYPRYDNYLIQMGDENKKQKLMSKFGCAPQKETLLWICTVTEAFSTILTYADEMEALSHEYNIIVRPHPLEITIDSGRFNQKVFDIVHKPCFILSADSAQEMSELYLLADIVVCDYGGSVFSALYLGKKMYLLNNAKFANDLGLNVESMRVIRKIMPSINDDSPSQLTRLLRDDGYWGRNYQFIDMARAYFFENVDVASPRVAEKLTQLLVNSKS